MDLTDLTFPEIADLTERLLSKGTVRDLRRAAEGSLFFFLVAILRRPDALHPWIYDRCNMVQRDPDGHLDLWARFHYKSTIITFAQTLRDIARDPELTFGIFSHTKGIARGFQKQIKRECETNPNLHRLWPDVFWREPRKESPQWSDESGIILRRTSNPKESTVESWGLVDGMPASRHYRILLYDDVVVKESIATPDQIEKTTSAWELSYALGSETARKRYAGTRYHPRDTYHVMMQRGVVTPRIFPATHDGTPSGDPVLMSRSALEDCRTNMGRNFSAQMFQQPTDGDTATFRADWLCHYSEAPPVRDMQVWIIVDPAGGKEKRQRKAETSDYSVFIVIGLHRDRNYYLLPGCVRDRLNLTQRADTLFSLKRRYPSGRVAYEEYGMQADIEHIRDRQEREQYRFHIHIVGGTMPKIVRIERLVPLFESYRIWMPHRMLYTDREGKVRDFIREFIDDEYLPCPVIPHDDMLDDLARIEDIPSTFPDDPGTDPHHSDPPARTNSAYDPLARKH